MSDDKKWDFEVKIVPVNGESRPMRFPCTIVYADGTRITGIEGFRTETVRYFHEPSVRVLEDGKIEHLSEDGTVVMIEEPVNYFSFLPCSTCGSTEVCEHRGEGISTWKLGRPWWSDPDPDTNT